MAGAFTESLHPRGPAGSAAGGQFVSGDSSKGEAGGKDTSDAKQRQVAAVQKLLGRPESGEFGPDDVAAVKKWQSDHGLTVDGVVGNQTLASLLGDDHQKPGPLSADQQKKLDDLAAGVKLPAKPAAPAKPPARPPRKPTGPKPAAPVPAPAPAKGAGIKAPGKGQAGPGADRAGHEGNPRIAELGKEFWERGKGAALIRWGTPRATTRCHRLVMQHAGMSDQDAWGYCAERHHAVTGKWPGEAGPGGKKRDEDLAPAQTRGAVEIGDDVDERALGRRGAGEFEDRELSLEPDAASDGLTLSGYAAVFNSPTAIRDAQGEFLESIAPGAFADSLEQRTPVLMFNHGQHPLIKDMPLGRITAAREDDHGLFVEARLTDNWLIQPVRDAIRDGAVSGMSFRFTVPPQGDEWSRDDGIDSRRITRAVVSELGPVVFPAYTSTDVSVRSALDYLSELTETSDITVGPDAKGAGGGDPRDAGQRGAHPTPAARQRDRVLRMEGIIRG